MPVPTKETSSQSSFFNINASNENINALLLGSKWGGAVGVSAVVYYSFPLSGNSAFWSTGEFNYSTIDGEPFRGFKALSAAQQSSATSALKTWANVANITFIKTAETSTKVGDIRIAATSGGDMDSGTYAYAFGPSSNPLGGDVWLNTAPPANGANYKIGQSGYHTLIHELGHALGLDHPFKESAQDATFIATEYEHFQYTVMSYSDFAGHGDTGYSSFYPTTPMLFDILAIQYLYGANMQYRTGNDTYVFNGNSTYYQTIWDAGGTDTIRLDANASFNGEIDLRAGTFSVVGKGILLSDASTMQYDNVAIAYNVIIENAIGGNGNDRITGNQVNNRLVGGAGNDTLLGGLGDDVLDGGLGTDSLEGGAGDDTYFINIAADTINEAGNLDSGDGVVYALNASATIVSTLTVSENNLNTVQLSASNTTSIDLTQIEHITVTGTGKYHLIGSNENNRLSGNASINSLQGGAGNDTLNGGLGIDLLNGGVGDDTYFVESIVEANLIEDTDGVDTIYIPTSFTANVLIENINLTGSANINATGNAEANYLAGNNGSNILNGLVGDDTMAGGTGSDIYYVDANSDQVLENVGAGVDLVMSAATAYVLGTNVENLTLIGDSHSQGTGNGLANAITGNIGNNLLEGDAGNDKLNGAAGDDTLNGGLGNDALTGGLGNDTYIVDSINDKVVEANAGGIDTVKSTVSIILALNVEGLDLLSSQNINGTGNVLNNVMHGNAGNNLLSGLAGNDSLVANEGNDTLDGGAGLDTLKGGAGDDTYVIDNIADIVDEELNNDTGDTVKYTVKASTSLLSTLVIGAENLDAVKLTSISNASLNLTQIEHLTIVGAGKFNLIGDSKHNQLVGNASANSLEGGEGNDTLNGGLGLDTLNGGNGDDTYIVDSLNEVNLINDTLGENTLHIGLSFTANANFQHITLSGSVALKATGNNANNDLIGNSASNTLDGLEGNDFLAGGAGKDTLLGGEGDDTLDGGAGVDSLTGGAGNDIYRINGREDILIELENAGVDSVETTDTYTLSNHVENLTLVGELDINGFGNASQNIIIGNGGDNYLDGLAGADTLMGGVGNDEYVLDNAGDTAIEAVDGGIDKVTVRFSGYTLADNIEHLLLDAMVFNGTVFTSGVANGNALDNQLTAGIFDSTLFGLAGNDTLRSQFGDDTLYGGLGDDTYYINGSFTNFDTVIEEENAGVDTIVATVNQENLVYDLEAHVENLTVISQFDVQLQGNGLNNVLKVTSLTAAAVMFGNSGNDTIEGGILNDTLYGGSGFDVILGGAGEDFLVSGNGVDILTGGADEDYFYFDAPLLASNADVITDFASYAISNTAYDNIFLSTTVFTSLTATSYLAEAEFWASDTATSFAQDNNDYLIYNIDTGQLYYDSDANGAGAQVLIATFTNLTTLTALDFFVV